MQIKSNSVLPSEMMHEFRKSSNMVPETQTNVSMCDELRQFGQKNTIHGLKNIVGKSSNCYRKIVWSLIVISSLGLLVYQIVDRVKFFYSYPRTINVQLTHNQSLPFPSSTICNQNLFKATWALKAGKYKMIEEVFSRQMDFKARDRRNLSLENMTLDDIYVQGAHKKKDFILNATWMSKPLTADDIDLVFTDHGVCYTFKGSKQKRVTAPGPGSGLRVTLNIEQYEYMPGHHETAGVKLLIHDPQEIPRVHARGQLIPPGSSVLVGVKLKETEELPPPHGTCGKESLHYLKAYTLENCRLDCLTRKATEVCGCRAPFMPHTNEVPPVCKLMQYGCLETVIDAFSNLSDFCNCPVSCRSRVFETDLSFGSLSEYSGKQFISFRDATKIKTDLLEAMETSSKYDESKLSVMKHFYSILTNNTQTISSLLVRSIQVVNDLSMWTLSLYKDTLAHYTFKEYLYRFQIHIMEENFMKARDEMEDTYINVVSFAYTEYIVLVEKSIRTLADPNFKDNSSRLCIYKSLTNRIESRIEIIEAVMANYTSLKNAYSRGKKLFNVKFRDTPRNHIDPATPRELINESLKHNSNAKRSVIRFKKLLKGAVKALQLCKTLADVSYRTGMVDETELWACIDDFRDSVRIWLKIRSMFYFEVVDRPVRILQERLTYFNSVWNKTQVLFQNINETLQSIHLEDVDFRIRILNPIRDLNHYLERYLSANVTKLEVSNMILSQNTKNILSGLSAYFQKSKTRYLGLKNQLSQLRSSLTNMWENISDDEDSTEYYKFLNKTEYLRNIIEVEIELEENFHDVLEPIKFIQLPDGNNSQLETIVHSIIDHVTKFRDSTILDDHFIRNNIIRIDVYFPYLSYERTVHQKAYDIFSLFCDIGGTMSLFLGASLLSVLEIVDFVLQGIINRGVARMRAKRTPSLNN